MNPIVNSSVFIIKIGVNVLDRMFPEFKNRMHVRAFIRIMLVYSDKNSSANMPPVYSTLKPDTSSDSPSVRSNGARLVSASVDTYHIIIIGQVVIISQDFSCVVVNSSRL